RPRPPPTSAPFPYTTLFRSDEWRLLLEQLAEGPGDLIGVRALVAFTEQRPEGRCGSGMRRQRADLLNHFDHRPIGDALPVRQATDRKSTRLNSSHVAISYAV